MTHKLYYYTDDTRECQSIWWKNLLLHIIQIRHPIEPTILRIIGGAHGIRHYGPSKPYVEFFDEHHMIEFLLKWG